MAMQTNFSKDESRKTFAELYHSEEVTEKIYGELIFLSVLNIFLAITASLGNTLILVALHKETSLHSPSKLLFRNLAITDLCVGIIAEPLLVAYLMSLVKQRWDISYYLHFADFVIGAILCSVSLFTLTAISVDRLLALSLGLRYRQVATFRKAYLSVIVMWVLSVLIGVAFYYLDQTPILDRSRFTGICICVCILGLCYTKIFFALRRSQIHVQGQVKWAIPLYLARYRKAVHSALWVQLTLVVCYLPFGIVTTFLPKAGEIFFLVYLIALTLIQLNSSLNPFIYCWKISEVRKAVKDTIRELFCSLS